MTKELTNQQQRIFSFIRDYFMHYGRSPSETEIARKLKIKWIFAVQKHLAALERKGYIERTAGIRRGIRPKNTAIGTGTPILGRIAAGAPLLAVENIEGSLLLDPALLRTSAETFLLKIAGMSMKDAGIFDGDLVLVRKQQSAEQGDIVAALVNDEATVKYFRSKRNAVILEPANDAFQPIVIEKDMPFSIIGKVVAVIRIIEGKIMKTISSKR